VEVIPNTKAFAYFIDKNFAECQNLTLIEKMVPILVEAIER